MSHPLERIWTKRMKYQLIRDEEEYRTKDPVKKHQFSYDQSIAMSNMHPEVTEKDQNQKKRPT